MHSKARSRMYAILEKASAMDLASKVFDVFMMSLIILNIAAIIFETVSSFAIQFAAFFRIFEIFSVVIFTVEYLLRIWACTANPVFAKPVTGRIRFALTPLALIDLVAILPFYLPMIMMVDLRFLRAVRLLRLFRLFKLGRYLESIRTIGNVLKKKKEELVLTIFLVMILLVMASSLMYFIENEAQPQAFSSIPAAMWWGAVTLTTVGYGDVYPVTPLGKFLGIIIALLGIGMFALPAGILGSGFVEEIQKRNTEPMICPHCGKNIEKPPVEAA